MSGIESNAKSLFFAALDRPGHQWPEFLDEACGDDAAVRDRVEQLLHAHAELGSIPNDTDASSATLDESRVGESPGAVIGPYQLLEQIGEGGFGIVFVAEQATPVRRKVALKVLKPGMDTRQVVARFEAERQALAIMDHPHIAQVFDGGATPSGRPYFVMELVRGLPITDFCDQSRLSLRKRLELFIAVCRAVQHAHHKGIIHRDLKPSNVLVTLQDGTPAPKVIDFGVAKAQGQELTDRTLITAFAQLIGTPLYMSPEQAGQCGIDVDTRSDVYSLGVLLYELLVGATPFDKKRLKSATYEEIRYILREIDPPCPSSRLIASPDTLPAIAVLRDIEPMQLTKLIRGELDWIVMKALEKDRDRRYASSADLAADLERFLRHEAVLAGPSSRWYRTQKLLRRHRIPVVAGAIVLVALVGGMIGTTIGLVRALEAEWIAKQDRIATENAQSAEVAAHTRTRAALDLLTDRFIGRAMLRQRQSGVEEQKFLREIERHYKAWVNAGGDDEVSREHQANGYRRVAQIRLQLGDLAGAETNCRQAIELYEGLAQTTPANLEYRRELARSQQDRGAIDFELGRHEGAVAAYRAALAAWNEVFDGSPAARAEWLEAAWTQVLLGRTLRYAGRPEGAEEVLRDLLANLEQPGDATPPNAEERRLRADILDELARALVALNRIPNAEVKYGEALAEWNRLLEEFPNDGDAQWGREATQAGIAKRLTRRGKFDEAETLLGKIVAARRKDANESPNEPFLESALALRLTSLGALLRTRGNLPDAERVLQEGAGIYSKLGESPYSTPEQWKRLAQSLAELTEVYSAQRRWREARESVDRAYSSIEQALAANPRNRTYQRTLRQALRAELTFPIEPGAHQAAAKRAEQLAAMVSASPRDINEAAWRIAQCAWNAAHDPQLAPDEKCRRAVAYAQRSLELPVQAAVREVSWQLYGHNFWLTDVAETE